MATHLERLGPYQLERRIGRGGMGTVFAAVADVTGESVAVKVLTSLHSLDDGFHDRFAAEIESLRLLNHANIVRILGYGDEDGRRFYAMELVDGCSLQEALDDGRRFPWPEAVRLGIQLCRALKHAHDRGVIHRDIKPANLLLTSDGTVKLSDFGIAKSFGNSGMTADGGVIGTAEYMSPEQAEGRPATHRSDLYSLGGVLYALIAGRAPFKAKSLVEMLQLQRFAEPEPLIRLRPDVPRALNDLIMQLLHKDPAKRMPSAMMTARALEAVLTATGENAKPAAIVEAAGPVAQGELLDPSEVANAPTLLPAPAEPRSDVVPAADDDAPAVTSEFRLAPAPARPAAAEPAAPVRSATGYPLRTFTPVDRGEVVKPNTDDDVPGWISPQTWALAAAMIAVGLMAWYWLQPPSAESLYERIAAATNDDKPDRMVEVEREIKDYLKYYPADRRSREMEAYLEEIDLYRLEKKFAFRTKFLKKNEGLSAVERAYLEAMGYVHLNPALGRRKLQALVDLYREAAQASKPSRECLLLAQRQLERLEHLAEDQARHDLATIDKELARADRLDETDPEQAERIRRAVVELYADEPWAEAAVARARKALQGRTVETKN